MKSSSVAIIGGADGPTAIFLSGNPIMPAIIAGAVVLAVAAAVIIAVICKK